MLLFCCLSFLLFLFEFSVGLVVMLLLCVTVVVLLVCAVKQNFDLLLWFAGI